MKESEGVYPNGTAMFKTDTNPKALGMSEGWKEKFDKRFDRIMSIGHKINGKKVTYNCQTDCKDDVKDFILSELKRQRERDINKLETEYAKAKDINFKGGLAHAINILDELEEK